MKPARITMQSQREHMEHFGHIQRRATSVFLLDFGTVLVVEFSQAGNACYLYEKPNAEQSLLTSGPKYPSPYKMGAID